MRPASPDWQKLPGSLLWPCTAGPAPAPGVAASVAEEEPVIEDITMLSRLDPTGDNPNLPRLYLPFRMPNIGGSWGLPAAWR